MPVARVLTAVVVAAAALPLTAATVALTPTNVSAHGAPTNPVSRAAACGPEGRYAATAACRAAVEAGAAVREWDNVRVSAVDGRDRERIPDGELCSGGLSAYRGLDLPRTDWPATELTSGARFTFRYRTTIPHRGTFRLYVTRPSYDPRNPLTWADLESRPFLTLTDPPVNGGAYKLAGRVPAGRSGRHLIYTVWQNSNTPDTYYSCSDVLLRRPTGTPTATPRRDTPAAGAPVAAASRTPEARPVLAEPPGPVEADPGVPVASVTRLGRGPLLAGVAVVTTLALLVAGRRLRRAGGPPPGRQCEVRNHRAGRRRTW